MSSPTSRTLKWFRDTSCPAQVVERFCRFSKRRIDLFGCIDIVAITAGGITGVQCTSGDHHGDRRAKMLAEPKMLLWVKSGGLLWLFSWSQKGPRGKRKLWTPRIEEITLEMFQ